MYINKTKGEENRSKVCSPIVSLRFFIALALFVIFAGAASAFSYTEFQLVAGDPMADAEFGRSIAIDGDCVVVGAAEGSDEVAVGPGSAYVFRRFGDMYLQEMKLSAPDANIGAEFGRAVAVKGNIIVVGARFAQSGAVDRAGAAYIFKKTEGEWSFVQKLTAAEAASEDNFGRAVALDNDLLVVTARKEDVSVENDGSAYVFRQREGVWEHEAKLTASDSTNQARFGQSVAVKGGLIIVGARDANTPVAQGAGAVYLFSYDAGQCTEIAKLYADDGARGDQFAFNVAVAGNLVAVGSRRADPFDSRDAGAVYLFKVEEMNWSQVAKLTASDVQAGAELGHSVAMSGDVVAAGARRTDVNGNRDQGAVYIFRRSGNQWTEEGILTAFDGGAGDEFGHSMAAHGNMIAVGANIADLQEINQGAGYVYRLQK